MKFCSMCGTEKSNLLLENELPSKNTLSRDTNIHVKQKNKFGFFKKLAVFVAISLVIFLAASFYIKRKVQIKFEAASHQLKCDMEKDGEACFLYANYISEEIEAGETKKRYLDKACTLIPKADNLERLANICADAGNLEAACNLKHEKSCYDDGEILIEKFLKTMGQKPKDGEERRQIDNALDSVRKSCEWGYDAGCNLYVRAIFHSRYHYWDLEQISEYTTKACEAGHKASCYFIKKGYFSAYGDIGELRDNAPLNYIRRLPARIDDAAFETNLSGRCTAIVNISKYGKIERTVELYCNHKAFTKMFEEDLAKRIYLPLLLDGRPERRISEVIKQEYFIADDRGRNLPFE